FNLFGGGQTAAGIAAIVLGAILVLVGLIGSGAKSSPSQRPAAAMSAPLSPALPQSNGRVDNPPTLATPARSTCPRCKSAVSAGDRFCLECGTPLTQVKAAPVSELPLLNQFCPNPNCGKPVAAGKKFCTACGAQLIFL